MVFLAVARPHFLRETFLLHVAHSLTVSGRKDSCDFFQMSKLRTRHGEYLAQNHTTSAGYTFPQHGHPPLYREGSKGWKEILHPSPRPSTLGVMLDHPSLLHTIYHQIPNILLPRYLLNPALLPLLSPQPCSLGPSQFLT